MLFLIKKTIIPVLAIGCLLSISKVHAINYSNLAKKGIIGGAFLLLAYEGMRDIKVPGENEPKKSDLATYHDTLANRYQSFISKVTTKKGIIALGFATGGTLLLAHQTKIVDTPLIQNALHLITPK